MNRFEWVVTSRGRAICALACALWACSSDAGGSGGSRPTGGGPTGGSAGKGAANDPNAIPGGIVPGGTPNPNNGPVTQVSTTPCVNLQCKKRQCPGGGSTTISGRVYDPAGRNPLYNVAVYVPNQPVAPLKSGASCDTCSNLYTGMPVAAATTDAKGNFKIEKAPDGADMPLVVQVGKWRREFKLPTVTACTDNPVPDKMLTLPKNQMEGNIPNIAISTGGADTLECLLRRVGVNASEYTPGPGGTGRIHIFAGTDRGGGMGGGMGGGQHAVPNTAPPGPMATAALWNTLDSMMPYDIVLLSCEGMETVGANHQVLHDYASAGGRVFASHFHYEWFWKGPYANENLATWTPESNAIGDIMGDIVTKLSNGMVFPKGQALFDWLMNVMALQNGKLPIQQARHNADVSAANKPSQSWITADASSEAPGATQYFSFNTPTDAQMTPDGPAYCGRVVYSDLHVGGASQDDPNNMPVPGECANAALSPQEKALEFMLFDLSSCLTPDDKVPPPPPVQ